MAKPTRTLTVNFVGRTDQLDKAYKRVNKGSQNMSATLTRGLRTGMTAFAGIGAAAAGFVALTKPMVDIAADVGESMSKNKVLFGDASESVAKFAKTASKNFGLSNRDALEAAGNFGALTHAMGMSGEEGAKMSLELVKLAADMASFNNADPSETLTALAAGLRGENEPLRRFGVLLDAATLKTKALEMGLIENTKSALDPATKALAAYEAIMEQSIIQQGDFQRTSDGLANTQRQLAADWTNLQEQIGEALLPIFQDVTEFLVNEGIPNLQKFINVWKDEGFFAALEKVAKALSLVFVEQSLENAINTGKALLAGFVSMIEAVRDAVNDALLSPFRLLDELAPGLINDIKNAFSPLFGWLESMASKVGGWWDTIFGGGQEADTGEAVGSITTPGFLESLFPVVSSGAGVGLPGTPGHPSNFPLNPVVSSGAGVGLPGTPGHPSNFPLIPPPSEASSVGERPRGEMEELAAAAAATVATPPRTPGATLADPRAAAFQGASLAGAAHTINVNINAPAVTTAEVNAAVANGFKNDAMLLESLYFI